MERDFKGVWIPREIWLNEELGWSEKLLLVEIDSLSRNGECFASNEYFARFLGLSKDRVSKMITALNRQGLITVDLIYKEGKKEIEKRILTATFDPKKQVEERAFTPIGENTYTPRQNHLYPLGENTYTPIGENTDTPIGENAYDINTSFINTSFNNSITNTTNKSIKKNMSEKSLEAEFEDLWKLYPNKKSKDKAKPSYIKARKNGEVTYEEVRKGIEMYVKYINFHGIDKTKVKHGSTWFNQKCWTDEYDNSHFQKKQEYSKFTNIMLNEMDNPNDFLFDLGVNEFEERRDRQVIHVN